ncbi:MAG TPA: hypothetical protein ENN24_04015 [Bacteroidetes bacterium]|nr:hypothetical protein [Bacteroidota bacterium]
MRILKLLFPLLFFASIAFAQDPTGSLSIIGGSSVNFHVNSLKKYDEGVTLESWSRLRIRFDDPGDVTLGWRLNLKAETLSIISDSGTDNLPLTALEIRAIDVTVLNGAYNGTATPSMIVLDGNYVELLSDSEKNNIDLIITISYDLGTNGTNKLMGSAPGYYYVDLRYQLIQIN